MQETPDVTLVSGLWRDGNCVRELRLAELDADAQRELVDALAGALPAQRVTGLVARAVESFGPDDARALTIGDRDRVVLALRRRLAGDAMVCVCHCACGQTLELTLSVDALL